MDCPAQAASLGIACEVAPNGMLEVAGHSRFVLDARPDSVTALGRFTPVYINEATWLEGAFILRLLEAGVGGDHPELRDTE